MKKVCMVEYQGRCDRTGKAVGHAPKVLTEYFQFIKEGHEVSVYAPKVILREFPKKEASEAVQLKNLPRHIVMKGKTPLWEKIINKVYMFSNIRCALRHSDADILWFFNVEYYLMLYLFLHKKPKQKIICTLFMDGYHAPEQAGIKKRFVAFVKQKIFEQAQKKIDLIIATGSRFTFKNCRWEYIPDFYDKKEIYGPYREHTDHNGGKEERAVCLGTMGSGKQLEEMTEAFVRINYPLTVAGRFYDKERMEALKDMVRQSGADIEIRDQYLSQDEYLSLLARAKYTVLPYAPENYATQTSGVMQEAVFLDTVPVTYSAILEGNGIAGVGFESWDALTSDMLRKDTSSYLENYGKLRKEEYCEASVKEKYQKIFAAEK